MSTIYKTSNSRYWFARFKDRTGKRISKSTKVEHCDPKSKKEARRIANKLESAEIDAAKRSEVPSILRRAVEMASLEAQAGTLTLQRAEDLIRQMTLAANPTATEGCFRRFSAAWLDNLEKDISEQSHANYLHAIKTAVAALGLKAEGPLRKITQADAEGIQAAFAAAGATGTTVNRHSTVIRRIFEDALNRNAIDRNPFSAIKSKSTADSQERLPFTVEEVRKLIAAASSDEWKGLITLASQTGIRCGDLRTLTAENITGTWLTLRPSKTSKSTGKIIKAPLTPSCIKWLSDRQPGPLFPELGKLDKRRLSAAFDAIMTKAEVPKSIVLAPGDPPKIGTRSFHSLRHSFVSWLAAGDVHSDVRQKLAGHSSAKVHALYSHHEESLVRAVESLPAL